MIDTEPNRKSRNQKPPPPPPDETCGWVLGLLMLAPLLLWMSFMMYADTCKPPRFNLDSLSVSIDRNTTRRAARWDLAFSITDDPKTTLPLVCRGYGNGNFKNFQASVVYSPFYLMSPALFEKTVTPLKAPRTGEVILVNTTIYTLLPPISDKGLMLEFEVGLIGSTSRTIFEAGIKRELHCKNMIFWFLRDDKKGNIVKGGGPLFDCLLELSTNRAD